MLIVIAFSALAVFVFFSLYSIVSMKPLLLLSIPISVYLFWLFFDTIRKNPKEIRNPENFIFSPRVVVLLVIWLLIILIALFLSK
jgi:hypothetical protein